MSQARKAPGPIGTLYERHRPEQTLLYQLIHRYYPEFETLMAAQGRPLPTYVRQEFEAYLRCGQLEQGFLRLRCEACKHEKLVAFSCKRRGFCPSCRVRRMVESAALLVDEVLRLRHPYDKRTDEAATSKAGQHHKDRTAPRVFRTHMISTYCVWRGLG